MHRLLGNIFATQLGYGVLLLLFLSRSLFGQETGTQTTLPQKYLAVPQTLTAENVPPVPGTYQARWSKYLAGYYQYLRQS